MIKLFYTIGLLVLLSACNQNTGYSPMLWEISGKQLEVPSYIFGTFHTKDPTINTFPSSVLIALNKSQRLYTEIPMSDKSTKEVLLFSKMPHPLALKLRLHPKTIKLLLKHLKKNKLPYTMRTLKPFKTWAIALILSNHKEKTNYPNRLFMDEKLVLAAQKKHIKQVALETPVEQLNYFDILSSSQQEQLLVDTLTQHDNSNYENALKSWYTQGEKKGFFAIQTRFASQNPKQQKLDTILRQGLLLERNLRFTRRIDILLQNKTKLRYFFAIGAGHMSGEKGIIRNLKRLGYSIKKIN